jgi:hypothetical protein
VVFGRPGHIISPFRKSILMDFFQRGGGNASELDTLQPLGTQKPRRESVAVACKGRPAEQVRIQSHGSTPQSYRGNYSHTPMVILRTARLS